MNADTVTLIDRPFQEIVDDILTTIVGGVVNEPIIFDLKDDLYPLAQPASDVRGITGTRTLPNTTEPAHVAFQKNVDFVFDTTRNAVVWPQGGSKPDDETTFYVDYFRPNGRSPLSDINVGSVTRTLSEAIGREIATVYQQINQAYLAGFIETAKGQSLDLVVAILGIKRKTKEFASGLVTFFRDPAVQGNITISEGTLLSTTKGVTFVTSELRTLQRGQVRIDVPVRATDAFKGQPGIVGPNDISTLAQPLAGIVNVSNLEATVLGSDDETDEQLRARARAALRGLGKATLAALVQAIFSERAKLAEVWDPNGPPAKSSPPGTVVLLVESEPERFAGVQAAVDETRAAGVEATVVAQYVFIKPRVVAQLAGSVASAGKLKVVGELIDAMKKYVDGLSAGDPAKGEDLLKALKGVKDVTNPKIVDVITSQADIGQPVAETLVDALLDTITATKPGDAAALRTALTGVVKTALQTAPTARRIPNRSLLQSTADGRAGQQATDTDIEAGKFQVVTPDKDWWIALDVEPADILLLEKS